jgi:zinc protease
MLSTSAAASCRLATPPSSASVPAATPAPDETFRAHPPVPEPRQPFVPPTGHLITLRNKMGLLVVERHGGSMVAAELVARGGTAAFPWEPPAAFPLMVYTLMRGTATRSEAEIYDRMNAGVFDLETSVGDAWVSLRARASKTSLDAALELLQDIALHPSFPAPGVERERQRQLMVSPRDEENAERIARRNLYGSVYGPSHPYARRLQPSATTLAKLTRDDVVRVWQEAIDPARSILVVAGDVDEATVRERVEALFGDWRSTPSRRPPMSVPPASPISARLILVDRPGAPQASVFYGGPIAPIDGSQQQAQMVVWELLGGMRSSVLETRLRDELGATWSGEARISARLGGGILWWEGSVARERTADVLGALERRILELRDRGPAADELTAAKALLNRSLPRELETVRGLTMLFGEIAAYGLPIDSLQTRASRLDATSADAVRAAVPEPSRMKAVVVGDVASLRAPLLALGWGPIEQHDAAGNFVRIVTP